MMGSHGLEARQSKLVTDYTNRMAREVSRKDTAAQAGRLSKQILKVDHGIDALQKCPTRCCGAKQMNTTIGVARKPQQSSAILWGPKSRIILQTE